MYLLVCGCCYVVCLCLLVVCCFNPLYLFVCCLSVCSYVIGLLIYDVVLLCCGSFDSLRCVCFLVVLRNA